ncbi:MAG TPA: AraC family transcriptional regulator [Arenibaculum sp.]|nr:AraC family transcriptional regulator [Arenibaculum sp.]
MTMHDGAEVVQTECRIFSGSTAVLKGFRGFGHYSANHQADCARLAIRLEHVGSPMQVSATARGSITEAAARGQSIHFVPAGMPVWGYSEDLRRMRYLALQFDGATPGIMDDDAINPLALVTPRLTFLDRRLLHLARLLEAELTSARPIDPLYGDSLFVAMLVVLSDLYDAGRGSAPKRGGLAPWQLRRATEYIQAHLGERVELGDLSRTVGLSQSYFCRAFRAATGIAPHQWQIEARMRRAKQLLIENGSSIAEIALDTGFADQAHFTRTFTRKVGTSPGAWRRANRT